MTTPPLLGARRLMELLRQHGIRPRKELGQNFVIDPNTIRKVVASARLDPGDRVLEIGAGAGSLTLGLAEEAAHVIAVEFDRALHPVLQTVLGDAGNVEVVAADAMAMELEELPVNKMVGNLPYNIAVDVVMRVLEQARQISALTVMTQREVGERLAASAGSKAYGGVSVMVRYFADARVVTRVSRNAFYPVPGVDSVLVHLVRSSRKEDVDERRLAVIVRAAFGQRRKTLRNALAPLVGSGAGAEEVLRRAGIDPKARAEEIDLEGFLEITRVRES
jgi:16S rRNA (adenine1518-N6/adenine1519-N6)-dimethyltransferase